MGKHKKLCSDRYPQSQTLPLDIFSGIVVQLGNQYPREYQSLGPYSKIPVTGLCRFTVRMLLVNLFQQVPADSESDELLLQFLHRVIHWLSSNYARSVDIFRKFDSDNDNLLSCEDFSVGLRIMEASLLP